MKIIVEMQGNPIARSIASVPPEVEKHLLELIPVLAAQSKRTTMTPAESVLTLIESQMGVHVE